MRPSRQSTAAILLASLLAWTLAAGCAAGPARAELEEMKVRKQAATKPLRRNHFESDRSHNVSEAELDEILESPILFDQHSRLGIVPVANAYGVDRDVPLDTVPKQLSESLQKTDYFAVTTEVSTDWPKDGGIAGLRELAARYRSEYLLLYRHRFVDKGRVNGWGWTWPTVVGLFATPAKTVDMAGVLEATLFDVRNGTILFTVYERVHRQRTMNVWHNRYKKHQMQLKLMDKAADTLTDKVTRKVRQLVVASREYRRKNPSSQSAHR